MANTDPSNGGAQSSNAVDIPTPPMPKLPRKPKMPAMKGASMAKGMKGGKTSKGFMGGGKETGFVNTPMNAPKKGFKGGK